MFKLESYLTPWLLGYLDKYVKLKPEDFQLSLWGGDAVFNKLDLRLNVIENLTNVPITFKSGVIHELRIHIPWTRITSEPVVVTINTLEFVAKLKDVDSSSSKTPQMSPDGSFVNSTKSESTTNSTSLNTDNNQTSPQQQQQQQQPMPTGYIQNIISKILFNICIIINNVIVKFVEDDMVLSFNMKSAECYSVNHLWEKTFVDVNTQNIHLRKILQLNDVTICLDKLDNKKNSNTKISFYQDPLIYRCSIQSRLDFKYSMSNSSTDFDKQLKLMKLNFYCRKFDVSITDQQLPMVIRLFELISAIVDGTLKLPETTQSSNTNDDFTVSINDNIIRGSQLVEELKSNLIKNSQTPIQPQSVTISPSENEEESQQQQGWISWAWSYVPSVSNLIQSNENLNENQGVTDNQATVSPGSNQIQMIIGCYFDEFNLSFKLTQQLNHQQQQQQSKACNFQQFMLCNTKGIALEVNKKENFSHILFGISHINIKSVGECCCKLCPKPNENEIIFLRAGNDYIEDKIFHYLTGSLFDIIDDNSVDSNTNPDSGANSIERGLSDLVTSLEISDTDQDKNEKSRDKLGNIDENYGVKRFGAIFMDFLNSAINLNKSNQNENDEKNQSEMDIDLELNSNQPDIFSLYFIFYGIEVNVSANLIHRLVKVYDCSQSHMYTQPYASLTSVRNDSNQNEGSLVDDLNPKINTEKLAKKFEKYIPVINYTFTFKEPVIKFHPYSHFLIAPIASQDSNYECYLSLNSKYIYLSITRPLDEKALFDIVTKLPNPSKKLIYDSYVHNQVTADTLKLNLAINDYRSNFKYESSIIEPCYFELHFSSVIMSSEMWNKQYFPLSEFILELPILKINFHKQFMFILNDYLDNYLHPLLNQSMIMQIKHPFINKSQMKKAKLRQMIYKRLLDDFIQHARFKKGEILRFCINDLKAKYSLTKIMQVIQLNCNMCNVYLNHNDQIDDLIPLIETSNKSIGKNNNIKDFFVLRAQLPLSIESENSYIPDPLFFYANVNEINIQIRDELINWLNYKPTTHSDDELLNLLVLELFDDVNDPELNENVNLLNKVKLNTQKQKFYVPKNSDQKSVHTIETASSSSFHGSKKSSIIQQPTPIKQIKLNTSQKLEDTNVSVLSSSSHKPTIIDTFYDLLKTLHIQISLKPITVSLSGKNNEKTILFSLPQIDSKSSGTKCDLEEELINSHLIELPCTYLRACERTSNKLPWLVELKNFQTYLIDQNEKKNILVTAIDFNTMFTVKPKYHQYDNLLSSLSIILNVEVSKKIDINLDRTDLNVLINWSSKVLTCLNNFEHRIDYKELEKTSMFDRNRSRTNMEDDNGQGGDWDDNKSYSTISILKEYDLSSFDEDDDGENSKLNSDANQDDFFNQEDHCSLSTGELSSSSSSISNIELKQKRRQRRSKIQVFKPKGQQDMPNSSTKMSLLSPVVHLIQREKNEDQVKINFSLNFFLFNLNLNLIDQSKMVKLSLNRLISESDFNNIYQKFSIKLKKFDVKNEPSTGVDSYILSSDPDLIGKNIYLNMRPENVQTSPINKQEENFLEFTFTNALISNLTKKLNDLNDSIGLVKKKTSRRSASSKISSLNSSPAQKWINEINLTIRNFDFYINLKKFKTLIDFYLDIEKSISLTFPIEKVQNLKPIKENKKTYLIPLIRASDVPLINLDLKKIRFIFPGNFDKKYLIFQIYSLTLTSQFENPLIRNFIHNSASLSIYNKAKSNGLLYRPGFIFEDRQYLVEVKNMAFFSSTMSSDSLKPILESFDLRLVLALPILFSKRLINGYALELNIPTSNLSFNFSDYDLNLISELINENMNELNKLNFKDRPIKLKDHKLEDTNGLKELEIVPLDILITFENINLSLYKLLTVNPLFYIQLIQPHVCFFMHEKLQKFEISVFDISIKRSLLSNDIEVSTKIPSVHDYVVSVLETKPGEPNPKTGILSGVFSFKISNFASLFCYDLNTIKETEPTSNGQIDQLTSSLICVCNNCLRCYELKNASKFSKMENQLSTQIFIERPIKLKTNFRFYEEIDKFMKSLKFFETSNTNELETNIEDNSDNFQETLIQILFDLNIQLLTSQVLIILEDNKGLDFELKNQHLIASLSGLALSFNRLLKDDYGNDETEKTLNNILVDLLIKKSTNNNSNSDQSNILSLITNHFNFKLNDLNLNVQLNEDIIHFLGPVTIKSVVDYDPNEKQLNSFVDFGSFSLTFNKCILDTLIHFKTIYEKYFSKNQNDNSIQNISGQEYQKTTNENESLSTSLILKYEDDLRNGSLKYKIIDDNYFKNLSQTNTTIECLLSHVLLPNMNEIICIDDLTQSTTNLNNDVTSSVCWRYSKRRALINLKILPLPFVGNSSQLDLTKPLETIDENSLYKTNLKCYIEYFNECTKRFVILKDFHIQEGVCTNVIDSITNNLSFKDLVYSKIWRIRLSKEAKRFIFASSLLASTRIDSIELTHTKKLVNFHLEFNISNIEFKINSIKQSFSQADLALVNLSEFSARVLYNQPNNSTYSLSYLTLNLYGQIGVDYCEYRFLTYRSLIDMFQFRLNSLFNLNTNFLNINFESDTVNILASQSGLIALKQLENEFNSIENVSHYYLIFNDTNLDLNIKQFDTEETCLIPNGSYVPYIWRTHKKAQLLQLFVSKYKILSRPFQINENCVDELSISIGDFKLDLIVNIETKFSSSSSFRQKKTYGMFKKFIFIQTKFLICNYLNVPIDQLSLKYNSGKEFDLSIKEPIKQFSRSKTSIEFIQSNTKSDKFQVNSLEINGNLVSIIEMYDQLRKGLLWHDKILNLKYWINLNDQEFFDKAKKKIIQYVITLTPVFIFCSYLPCNLVINLRNLTDSNSKKYILKSESVSYYSESINTNQLTISFDDILNFNNNVAQDGANFLSCLDKLNKNWFNNKVNVLLESNFNISACESFENKALIHVDLFKFVSLNKQGYKFEDIDLIILKNEPKSLLNGEKTEAKSSTLTNIDQEPSLIPNNFFIDKSACWTFSKTIRVDIKPECLVVNKTGYQIRLHEKVFNSFNKDENQENEIIYDIDSNSGKFCLSNIGISSNNLSKKFKLSICMDEYSFEKTEHVDLAKIPVEYESDWIEIKDEPVSPFYRERFTSKMNCLYLNKCWIDVKLFPTVKNSNSRLKQIYLVMGSEDLTCLNKSLNELVDIEIPEGSSITREYTSRLYETTFRLLTIQTKFLIKNKTENDFKLKIFNDFSPLVPNLLHKFVQTDENTVKSLSSIETGSIINRSNFYINETRSELNEFEYEKEQLSDLFYLALDDNLCQSKSLVLTCKEKPIKQITNSPSQVDDNLLINRQCFCIYNKQAQTTQPYILTQKLLIGKNGQLLIVLKEDKNHLVNIYNDLDYDLLVWPRLSTNFIFENYVRNCNIITDRLVHEKLKSQGKKCSQNDFDSYLRSSLFYMHLIPAKTWFMFNYDFIGTNHFPIENLNEQIFFMFAILNKQNSSSSKLFDLSPNLCKIYDNKTEISFEDNKDLKLFYLSDKSSNRINFNRIVTDDSDKSINFGLKIIEKQNLILKLNLNIERITLALNDDYLSQIYQTEILRLTMDNLNISLDQDSLDFNINFNLKHLQLDNQMFDLNDIHLDNKLTSTAQKYDFPVIFLPRDQSFRQQFQLKSAYYYKTFDWIYQTKNGLDNDKFLEVKLNLGNLNDSLSINEFDFTIKPFDLYLEDYLIYNIIKIGIEFLEFASIEDINDETIEFNFSNDESDLDILTRPGLKIRKLTISKIDGLVSLQTSIKLYLATYKMPILFDELKVAGLPLAIMSSPQLVKLFTSHYLTSLLFRAGWLLGSLDLIGSPTAFIQQVSNGVFDFLQMPYRGLRSSGPTGLLQGFSNGSLSLIRNLSAGTITSLTSFASFVSRNMDILSFDPHHLARQEHFRHQTSESFGSSLLQVSSSFIVSIMGAIGGLAEQPIQSVHNSDSFIKGVSKGLIGLVTKPVGAVAELVNQTGQGLLRITGVNRLPLSELRLQRRALNKEFSRFSISSTKCLWKLLNSVVNKIHINAMIDAVYTNSSGNSEAIKTTKSSSNGANLTGCYLVLSDDILYILDKNEDMLLRAFYISQIDIKTVKNFETSDNETVLCITLNSQKVELFLNEYQKLYENTMDRLVDYVMQSNKVNEENKVINSPGSVVSEEELELNFISFKPFMSDYYQFSRLNNCLNKNMLLVCSCSSVIKCMNLIEKIPKTPVNSGISESSLLTSATLKQSPQVSHSRDKSISDVFFNNESLGSNQQKHVRQASIGEIPKIHRSHNNSMLSPNNTPLIKTTSNSSGNENESQQKKFYYYVDPRVSANFINIFNSLKRKASNKGFQF